MKKHFIICGYGRLGKVIAQELKSSKLPLLVVEKSPELKQELEQVQIPHFIGDATDEEALIEAGIKEAKGLVAVVASESDNLFITITARGLNPRLFIVVRAGDEKTRKKLLRAGANRVVLPYLIGGQKMAQIIVKPAVTDFLELTVDDKGIELKMEELQVGESSTLNGVNLVNSGIRRDMNVIIVAIMKKSGNMAFNPSSHTLIEAGDTLIALGLTSDLDRLKTILAGE